MARSFSIAQQDFPPATYGPFNLDSFTSANTSELRISLTNPARAWPHGGPLDPIMRVTYGFLEVGFNILTIEDFLADRRTGLMPTTMSFSMGVPHVVDASGNVTKQPVSGAQVTIEVFKTVNCSVLIEAL